MKATAILIAATFAVVLPLAAAQAQNAQSFVSGQGSDSNPCTLAAPCRTLAQAVASTVPGGGIDALDAAGYGPAVITGSISIEGHGFASISPGGGGIGVNVAAAATDVIDLRGLVIEGQFSATHGFAFSSGRSLSIENCVVRGVTQSAVSLAPGTTSNVLVAGSLLDHNGGDAILASPSAAVTVTLVVDRTVMNDNAGAGVFANTLSGSGAINAVVSESVASGNSQGGFILATGASPSTMTVFHSVAGNNGTGVEALGQNATLRIAQSEVTGNTNGWTAPGNGTVLSYGDNYIDGNSFNQTAPPSLGLK
jgi:hypothetical protein